MRRSRARATWIAATLVAVLVLAATFFAFSRELPFRDRYEVHGLFASSNQLRPGGEVRMGGLRIGRVVGVDRGPAGTSRVTLRLDDAKLRTDARLAIRPRLPLEGNYYVAVSPGTPRARVLPGGGTIPQSQTSVPVQLDQLLGVFTTPTRSSLKGWIREWSRGLGPGPEGAGHEGLRRAARELDLTLGAVTDVARAARGSRPGDLPRAMGSLGELNDQLSVSPRELSDLVTNYHRVLGTVAANDRAVRASLRELDRLFASAPATLRSIQAGLPPLARFARHLEPTLRAAPPTLRSLSRSLAELDVLARDRNLPRLLRRLEPVTGNLPVLNRRLRPLFPLVESASRCVLRNVVPTLNATVEDGPLTTGQPVWQELFHMTVGLSGFAQGFDGNGTTLRLGLTQDDRTLAMNIPSFGEVAARGDIQGVVPMWLGPGVEPPYRPDARCADQTLPDLDVESRKFRGRPGGARVVPSRQDPLATKLRNALLAGDVDAALRALEPLRMQRPGPATPRGSQRASRPAAPRPGDAERRSPSPGPASPAPAPPGRPAPVDGAVQDLAERLLEPLLQAVG